MDTMSPARFTFDLDLGRRQERNRTLTDSALEALLDEARSEGFARGFSEGERSAAARASTQLAAAADALSERTIAVLQALDQAKAQLTAEAADLALSIARKLALNLVAREPTGEIEALIAECMASLDGVPHLVIRCHPELADKVRALAEERMKISGYAGRLVVMGDPDQRLGDARLEWVDGGLVRDLGAINAQIDERIRAYLGARTVES